MMLAAFLTFMEMAIVLGTFLLVGRDGGFEFRDRDFEFVVADDAALAKPLADNADEILGEILQHHHVRAGVAFERNQHGSSLFVMLDPRVRRPSGRFRTGPAGSIAGTG
jgi:hypothetical protein